MPHIHEKIDFTVEVLIIYQQTVLLRLHDKYKKWLSIGGHIELNEDPNEAAIREVKEETGLEIELVKTKELPKGGGEYRELIPPEGLNRHTIGDSHEHVTLIYFAKAYTNDVHPEEHEQQGGWKWFTKDELKSGEFEISRDIVYWATKALEVVI